MPKLRHWLSHEERHAIRVDNLKTFGLTVAVVIATYIISWLVVLPVAPLEPYGEVLLRLGSLVAGSFFFSNRRDH